LRDPRKSLWEYSFASVEEKATVSEAIRYRACGANLLANSSVPFRNSWVELEPSLLETFGFSDSDSSVRSHSSRATSVVGSMHPDFSNLTLLREFSFDIFDLALEREKGKGVEGVDIHA
jgi:hypothetical protein